MQGTPHSVNIAQSLRMIRVRSGLRSASGVSDLPDGTEEGEWGSCLGSFGEGFVKCRSLFQEERGECDDNAPCSKSQAKKKIGAIARKERDGTEDDGDL